MSRTEMQGCVQESAHPEWALRLTDTCLVITAVLWTVGAPAFQALLSYRDSASFQGREAHGPYGAHTSRGFRYA